MEKFFWLWNEQEDDKIIHQYDYFTDYYFKSKKTKQWSYAKRLNSYCKAKLLQICLILRFGPGVYAFVALNCARLIWQQKIKSENKFASGANEQSMNIWQIIFTAYYHWQLRTAFFLATASKKYICFKK